MEEGKKQNQPEEEKKIINDDSDESPDVNSTEKVKDRLESKLTEAYGKHDDLQNKYLRVHADLENVKKRAIKEREDAVYRTRSQIMNDLLPVIDSFKMGMAEASKHEQAKTFVEGFSMAMNQLENTLNEYGLNRIDSDGMKFDPKIHDAISYEENEDIDEGIVVTTIREGYKLGEKLIRPASVILSKGKKEDK